MAKELIWIWNGQQGVQVREGGYSDHYLFQIPSHVYDSTVRGYAEVYPKDKTVTLSFSEVTTPENRFYPIKAVNYFVKNFRGYQITKQLC